MDSEYKGSPDEEESKLPLQAHICFKNSSLPGFCSADAHVTYFKFMYCHLIEKKQGLKETLYMYIVSESDNLNINWEIYPKLISNFIEK